MAGLRREFLGRGWKFPIRPNGRGGLSYSAEDQSISEAIWIILSTPVGTRVMRPEFGCGIHDLTFASSDPNTVARVNQSVQQALVRYEPRIDVLGVRAVNNPETPNTLMINVDYRVRANNAVRNLVYPFYIGEGVG
ncbi:MAG: GPW/gp25 family protein, partial [Pseudomonadota bacterium]